MKTIASEKEITYVLKCPLCSRQYDAAQVQTFATCCNQPLITEYRLAPAAKEKLITGEQSMWRYRSVLPLRSANNIVSLGEGWTPVHALEKIQDALLIKNLLVKDESVNPTGSFKARGISMAISKAKELGITHCIVPTAGNAGGALSAYCARAGMQATVIMPAHTPVLLQEECKAYGAELILEKGLIDSCGKRAKEISAQTGAFDFSTLKEPYRLEGKKTMGYEIAEQLDWHLPDVIVYPTGGGTGLIGMWKAFQEMQALGWINTKLPRMVAVQTSNCKPIVEAFATGDIPADFHPQPSQAYGLAVPYPFARKQILEAVQQSGGTVAEVGEEEMQNDIFFVARREGLLLSLEGSACISAIKKLRASHWIKEEETVLFLNTGSWYKYH